MDGTAKGELYLDDGESLDVGTNKSEISFTWDGQALHVGGVFGYATDVVVEKVVVFGVGSRKTQDGPWVLSEGFGFLL